jgi:hypothetical protein
MAGIGMKIEWIGEKIGMAGGYWNGCPRACKVKNWNGWNWNED